MHWPDWEQCYRALLLLSTGMSFQTSSFPLIPTKLLLFFFLSRLPCIYLALISCFAHFLLCFDFHFFSSWEMERLVCRTRRGHSFTCCSFLGLANKWHMCSVPSSTLQPPLPMCLHEKGIRDGDRVCMWGWEGDVFRLLQTSCLWPVLRAGGWPSLPHPLTSIIGLHVSLYQSCIKVGLCIALKIGYKTCWPDSVYTSIIKTPIGVDTITVHKL